MMKPYLMLVIFMFCCNQKSMGQLVGGECFLQGTFLEIGINNNGALGSCNAPPAGYHQHCTTCTPGGGGINSLAEVYDWGHDGWATGTPAYMGDYTNPGAPFEGWSLQANGQINEAFQSNICPGAFGCCHSYLPTPPVVGGILTGSNTSYSITSARITGDWAGTALSGAMAIKQETRVDVNASWVVMTVHLYNTTALPITDVYYLRSCDPDNTTMWTAGTSATTNKIVYQNDWNHRVLVSAIDDGLLNPAYDSVSAYLGLGTKDCRAKATFFDYSGAGYGNLFPDGSPSDIWNENLISTALSGATPFYYPYIVNTTSIADEGIALVFKIGTIAPNDSAVLSYAYIFNGNSGLDSAFPDPVLSINNDALTILPVYPFNHRDTFDACLYSASGTFPMDIPFATDKSWTWSKWTWMPSTGLSATTGTHVTVNTNLLSGVTTYTVIGVDSAANNFSCNYKTFIFSIKPCHGASSNSPCYGDLVYFGRGGDSLGATYLWLGPGGFTSTLHHPIIYPALYTDSGMYYVIRTIGGVHDTDSTRVVIHEKPVITATYNAPLCANVPDTLKLSVTPLLPGEVFSWTGPNSFTSALQFPTINDFSSTDVGTYTVIATTPFGCRDTASIYASLVSPPDTPTINGRTLYCQGDVFSGFTAIPNPAAAGTVRWYTSASGGIPSGSPASIYNTAIPGSRKIYASVINSLGCESARASLEMTVIYKPVFSILPGNTFVCQFDSVSFAYNGPSLFQPEYTWSLPPNGIYAHTEDHVLSGPGDSIIMVRFDSVTANTYIHLHVSNNNGFCSSDTIYRIRIVAPPLCTAYTPDACQGDTVTLALTSRAPNAAKFAWAVDNEPLDQTTALAIIAHNSNSGGPFSISWSDSGRHVIQVQSSSIEGCASQPVYDSVEVHARPDASFTYLTKNGTLCLEDSVLFTARNTDYGNSYKWTPEHFFNNTNQREIYGRVELSHSTITLLVTNPFHCTATTSQELFPESCCTVKFPTAFTPNGDGTGDYFHPLFEGYHRFSQFSIANRWGQIVFESANSDVKWDGSYNGVPQDIGVYFYYIRFDCGGKTTVQAGDVTLIR